MSKPVVRMFVAGVLTYVIDHVYMDGRTPVEFTLDGAESYARLRNTEATERGEDITYVAGILHEDECLWGCCF